MSFLNVVEIESALIALNAAYPGQSQLITLPFATAEGRRSHALMIRGGPWSTCRRNGVLIISGAHAREDGGPDILVNFATDLLEAYVNGSGLAYGAMSFTAADIVSIVHQLEVIIFPNINPDGRNYHQVSANGDAHMWRKNRNPASSAGAPARIGVDPNRNYDFLWDFPVKFLPTANPATLASTDPSNDLFHGTAPFSDPEAQNVRWLFDSYPGIRWFMDVHSYGGDVLYPWGDDQNQVTDPAMTFTNVAWDHQRGVRDDTYREYIPCRYLTDVQQAATVVRDAISTVRGQPYTTAQSFGLPGWPSYPTSGASDDWAFARHFADSSVDQVYGFVIEFNVTHTFFPTWAQMVDIIADVDAGLVALCLHARPGPFRRLWCEVRHFVSSILWRRLLPPELWGPYGPWTQIQRIFGPLVERITRSEGTRRISGPRA